MVRTPHRTTMATYDGLVLHTRADLDALVGLVGAAVGGDLALVALLDDTRGTFRHVVGCGPAEAARLLPIAQFLMLSCALREVEDLQRIDDLVRLSPGCDFGVRSFAGRGLRDADGAVMGVCGVFHREPRVIDASARAALAAAIDRVEQQLCLQRELERLREKHRAQLAELDRLRGVLRAAIRFAIVATDTDGTITSFNEGAEAILGWRAEEVVGRATPVRFHADRALRARGDGAARSEQEWFGLLAHRAREGEVDAYECAWRRRDGAELDVGVVMTAVRSEEGELTGYAVIAQDISERRAVDRMRSEFVASVSHELRTPLTAIRGALGLLAGGVAPPGSPIAEEMVRVALANSLRLMGLVDDLLDVARMESGRQEFQLRPCALGPLVEQALDVNRPMTEAAGVALVLCPPPPDCDVRADPDRVVQVITNLLSNAARFAPRGTTVKVRVVPRGDAARVEVQDQGPGIPAEWHGRIFEKFVRVDPSAPRGTGLGLHIVRSIVSGHGGAVGVDSAPGLGSTFWFELPVAR